MFTLTTPLVLIAALVFVVTLGLSRRMEGGHLTAVAILTVYLVGAASFVILPLTYDPEFAREVGPIPIERLIELSGFGTAYSPRCTDPGRRPTRVGRRVAKIGMMDLDAPAAFHWQTVATPHSPPFGFRTAPFVKSSTDSTASKEGHPMIDTAPPISLNNGVGLPALGFGVFQTPPDVTQASVEEALRVGYRMVDTAASYLNEPEVGAAIAVSGVPRPELFIQTKVWVSNYSYDGAMHAFDVSTRKLGVDYIDLYMLHQPLPQDFDATVAAYQALERLLSEGRVRAIGVSNFSVAHLTEFLPKVSVVPAVNQIEVHPYYNQPELRQEHARRGIATQAWSPLGGVYVYRPGDELTPKNVLTDPVITATAERYGKTAAQVVLRWHIDSGRSAIPKSVKPPRIAENLDVFDFVLTADELAAIDELNTGVRGGPNQDAIDFRTFNRPIPE